MIGLVHTTTRDIHNTVLWYPTGHRDNTVHMDRTGTFRYEITLAGETTPHAVAADGYAQEGPLTTFFLCDSESVRLDSWATRLASFRSSDIRSVTRADLDEGCRTPELALASGST